MIQSLHTHTTFCDGASTAEEMVISAITKGLTSFGFSGHSPIFGEDWCITDLPAYKKEVLNLKEKYRDKLEIFLGIEADFCYPINTANFDYVISSVHGVVKDNTPCWVDLSKDNFISVVDKYYQGNVYKFIEDYYDLVAKAAHNGDILGHFDLISKFNKDQDLFDETSSKYQNIAYKALKQCLKTDIIFEINTGAIQRGYQNRFYPAYYFLDLIKNGGGNIIVTADAHHADGIDFWYNEAVTVLKDYGFTSQMMLTKSGFQKVKL